MEQPTSIQRLKDKKLKANKKPAKKKPVTPAGVKKPLVPSRPKKPTNSAGTKPKAQKYDCDISGPILVTAAHSTKIMRGKGIKGD